MTLSDFFETISSIKSVRSSLFDLKYEFVSFHIKSLFTNVPLDLTSKIILDRIYDQNIITTNLKKRTLQKLIFDSCAETPFSFNGKLYEQNDGVSMGSSLGPVLANIILTELEKRIVSELIQSGVVKFYKRYDDETPVSVKPEDIQLVLEQLNSFHPNLKFIFDEFADGNWQN